MTLTACTQVYAQMARSKDKVPTRIYVDEAAKVSFRYPLAWKRSETYSSYFPAAIAPNSEPLKAVVSFGPEGNTYARTNLSGIDFVYRRLPAPALKDCLAIVASHDSESGDAGVTKPETIINGVRFTHISTSDAGMSKDVDEQVYLTFRQNTCFLFEEDLHIVGEGVMGDRLLTAGETAALKRHLDDVMQTVTFGR